VLSAHDCPRAQLPPQPAEDPAAVRRDRRRAPGANAQSVLTHELNKIRFAALRRGFAAALPADAAHAPPGVETFPQAMARHRSQTGPGAMSWVAARPASAALTMPPAACRLALRRALGVEAYIGDQCPLPTCARRAPCDERHARLCRAMDPSFVHHRIRDALSAILTSYGVRHHVEDPTPFTGRNRGRKMDITTLAGALPLSGNARFQRRGSLLDVTIADPHARLRAGAATRDGAAAIYSTNRKLRYYSGRYVRSSYDLWPLALESYGRWGGDAEELFDAIATHAVGGPDSVTWRAKGAVVHSIRQRLAVTLQRAVSQRVMYFTHRRLALQRAEGGDAADAVPLADFL
jgi:hypothetical protein